ncbi:hypothetical protein C0995_002216 [Termitomyces sp. Mi166|nr:hypothetical protein C0995_002216 [Termitomyces sp. Mi166\
MASSNKRLRTRSSTNQATQDHGQSLVSDVPATKKVESTKGQVRAKKLKPTEEQVRAKAIFHSADEFSDRLRTAFDLQRALKKEFKIKEIGYSLTTYEEERPPNAEQQRILKQLRDLVSPKPYKSGEFDEPFHLTITRSRCKFDKTSDKLTEKDLEKWFENASISGYGDNRSLKTKTDLNVRDAREISSDGFSVQPELLERISSTWKEQFAYPASVRVAPYKIHIYGPGGHFKSHRDTPEPGLIGTFLLGLGETSSGLDKGYFHIDGQDFRSDIGKWVALYPDVSHSIAALPQHYYRAVIAFKIFSTGKKCSRSDQNLELQSHIEKILHGIPRPFGILLDHSYHLGAAELNGYDAILLAGAQACQDSVVHVLPVIISTDSRRYYEEMDQEYHEGDQSYYRAYIKPFLPAHVEILNERSTFATEQAIKFLEGLEDVPFYCSDFKRSANLWEEMKSDIGYTGNEADGERESSIYLSHALLVMPTGKGKGR